MASEKEFELLDDYITNRLHGEEKTSFERRLEADSDLKSEYKLQQGLVEGLKKARVAELKSTLNSVAVPSVGGQTSLLAKLATSLVVAGMVGTGIYFFFNSEDKEKVAQQQILKKEEDKTKEQEPEPIREEVKSQPDASTIAPAREETSTVKKKEQIFSQKKTSEAIVPNPETTEPKERKLEVFDPTQDAETGHVSKETTAKANSATVNNTTIAVEVDNSNKKFNFHYQFKDDKLLLYGSFEKNLYEIMEFFSDDNKRTVFLFYKDNYYLLNEDNQKIKPLVPITDQALIKKLKESRG